MTASVSSAAWVSLAVWPSRTNRLDHVRVGGRRVEPPAVGDLAQLEAAHIGPVLVRQGEEMGLDLGGGQADHGGQPDRGDRFVGDHQHGLEGGTRTAGQVGDVEGQLVGQGVGSGDLARVVDRPAEVLVVAHRCSSGMGSSVCRGAPS